MKNILDIDSTLTFSMLQAWGSFQKLLPTSAAHWAPSRLPAHKSVCDDHVSGRLYKDSQNILENWSNVKGHVEKVLKVYFFLSSFALLTVAFEY